MGETALILQHSKTSSNDTLFLLEIKTMAFIESEFNVFHS